MSLRPLLVLVALFASFPLVAAAGVLSIVTDQESMASANDFRNLLRRSPCFRDLKKLDISIRVVPSSVLQRCSFHPLVTRVFSCEPAIYSGLAAENNSDRVIVIKEASQHGGSGSIGGVGSAMTTASPPNVGLHELLHSIGFQDEYPYESESVANIYCARPMKTPNISIFRDYPPYPSDSAARARHASDIPWLARITASTITTLPQLGTSEPNRIGLYPAATCARATSGFKSWRPGDESTPNIMQSIAAEATIPESFCPVIRQVFQETEPIPSAAPPRPSEQTTGRQ